MTLRSALLVVVGWGSLTALLLLLGFDTIGGLAALVQLFGLIGIPLAMTLYRQLRSWSVVAVLGVALSFAVTAVAAQSLVWFGVLSDALLVIAATAYGCALTALVAEVGDDDRIEAS